LYWWGAAVGASVGLRRRPKYAHQDVSLDNEMLDESAQHMDCHDDEKHRLQDLVRLGCGAYAKEPCDRAGQRHKEYQR